MENKPSVGASSASDESVPTVGTGLVMPKFDGHGSVQRFLDDFERYSKLQGWDEEQKSNVFPLSLTGVARDAFDGLPAHRASKFQEAAAGLKEAFVSKTVTEQHIALRELRFSPGENLDSFVIRFRKLMSLAFPTLTDTGPLLFSHFLATLPAELHAAVIADGIASFDGAVSKVRNVTASQTYPRRTEPDVVRRLESDGELSQLAERVASLEAAVRSVAQHSGAPGRRQDHGPRLCLCCGGQNHVRDRCRLRNRTCFRCHSVGHLAVMCPQLSRLQGNVTRSGRGESGFQHDAPLTSDRTAQNLVPCGPQRM